MADFVCCRVVMVGRLLVLTLAGACNYTPQTASGGDDEVPTDATSADAAPDPDSSIDAAVLDAASDAPPGAQTMAFVAVADLYLRTGASPNENTNDRSFVIVDGDIVAVPLFRFDVSAISGTATVSSATLTLFDEVDPGGAAMFFPLLEGWDEATATSNQRMAGVAWSGAGATPPSRSTTSCGTITPSTPDISYDVPLDVAVVQGWVMTPATNFGIALVTTNSDGARFSSRESTTQANRPTLTITFLP